MASLRERSPGRWQARIYLGLDPVSGKRLYKAESFAAASRKAAETKARKLERQVTSGNVQRGTVAVTLGEHLATWMSAKAKRLAPGTSVSYKAAIELAAPLAEVPLSKLSAKDLDRLYAELERSGKASATTTSPGTGGVAF